ncbi:toll/interleukin-1 receptor domain-containing protein [Frankia sp. ArI3]|uniref:toll/interleukin-1 receptor domain-containing protein n=1 Tax=Frankia sp. ArI3 TaxID=1858 RepID=UPI0021080696|nr:toll/interleukin-1 receptor domain-containing protein [Frankia sp. ArI3]
MHFFVSYTGVDQRWAEWISWQLEEAGYQVLVQPWDFGAGAHLVYEMNKAASTAARTVAVVSSAYLTSAYAGAEWQVAWSADPSGTERRLLPVRVEDCPRPGLLGLVVGVDLFGVDEETARERLLAAVTDGRGKPERPPAFPGGLHADANNTPPRFPGPPEELDAVWQPGRSPFPGLAAFDASRAAVFIGRNEDAQRLAAELGSPAGDSAGLLVVVGPSGCGKSSLVAAGLAPRLMEDTDWLVLRPMTPGGRPLSALVLQRQWSVCDLLLRVRRGVDGRAATVCFSMFCENKGRDRGGRGSECIRGGCSDVGGGAGGAVRPGGRLFPV